MMGQLERYLERLKKAQTDHADQSLRIPKQKDSFGYGEASGLYQGLLLAEQLLIEVVEESEKDNE